MKTKNTRELRLRARHHRNAGHVIQGTYGKGKVNGHADFRGCAIGCLSTPHRKRDLIRYLRERIGRTTHFDDLIDPGSERRKAMTEEFGLTPSLLTLVEGLFECQITHAEAIDFVDNFAQAVPEGVDIRDRDVDAFCVRLRLPVGRRWGVVAGELRPDMFSADGGWTKRKRSAPRGERKRVEATTEAFLAWLRGGARVPAIPKVGAAS